MIPVEHALEAGQMLLKVGSLREGITSTGKRSFRGPISDYSRLLILENSRKVDPKDPDFIAFTAPRDPFSPLSKLCDLWESATEDGQLYLCGPWGTAWMFVFPNPNHPCQSIEPSHHCYLAALPPRRRIDTIESTPGKVLPRSRSEDGSNGVPVADSDPQRRTVDVTTPQARTFRIVFVIERDSYSVKPLDSDPRCGIVKAYRFRRLRANQSNDSSGDYVCSLSEEGTLSCECKGFLRWGHCKHLRTLKAAGMLDLPCSTTNAEPSLVPAAEGV